MKIVMKRKKLIKRKNKQTNEHKESICKHNLTTGRCSSNFLSWMIQHVQSILVLILWYMYNNEIEMIKSDKFSILVSN